MYIFKFEIMLIVFLAMNKKKTTLLVVDGVSDVMEEAVSLLVFYFKGGKNL